MVRTLSWNCRRRGIVIPKGSKGREKPGVILGKIWERTQKLKTPAKSHRINGPCVFVRAYNPKVVSSNLTPATKISFLSAASANAATIQIENFLRLALGIKRFRLLF